jgi:F-type H+-transporting ATPase subunit gamma
MAGQLKEVRNRIKSIQSTQQITKAMKMISATKLRKAQEAIHQMRPYSKKLQQLLGNIVSDSDGSAGSPLSTPRPVEKALLILITSDRSSCGAYNSNLIKLAKATIAEKYPAQAAKGQVMIWSIGKKGYEHFAKNNYPVNGEFRDIFQNLRFENVQACAQAAIRAFENREFDAVDIVYSEFKNASTQLFVTEPFLPIPKTEKPAGGRTNDFIFEPSKEELVRELDANASEHGARMTAMDKATENANEILRTLRISYNRARQAAITTELTEIVSGAAALQG